MFRNKNINFYYGFIYLFIYLALSAIISLVDCAKIQNPNNYHYYEYTSTPNTNTGARNLCQSSILQSTPGYLATITSIEEWSWIFTTYPNLNVWTSGTDLGSVGVWRFNDGPENGQKMYNLYFDKSYTFSGFDGGEPNLIDGENFVNAKSAATGDPTPSFNNIDNSTTRKYGVLCEWDFVPYISTTSTTGGLIKITKLSQYNISSLTVTFTNILDPSQQHIYSSFESIDIANSIVTLNILSGSGKYKVLISDGTLTSDPLPWNYELPFISTIYPNFASGDLVTIVGNNFGINASVISVTFTPDGSVNCINPAFIIPNKAFTCVLSSIISTSIIPIVVRVGGVSFKSFKTSVFYSATGSLYSGFQSIQTFDVTMNDFSAKLKLDGLDGYLSVINTDPLFAFIKKTIPVTSSWNFWQAANFISPKYYYLAGPLIGQETTLCTTTGATPSLSTQRFYINGMSGVLTISSSASNTAALTQFGGYTPTYLDGTQTYPILTQGQILFLKLKNFGITLSSYNILINGNTFPANNFEVNYIDGGIYLNIPSSFILGGPYLIEVNIDSQLTIGGTQNIIQSPPTISSISSVPTTGGQVTITGSSLYSDPSQLSILIGNVPCTNIEYITLHLLLTCNITAGTGQSSLLVTVGTIQSNIQTTPNFSYEKPYITSLTKSSTVGGLIEVQGTNFGTDPSLISITIGGVNCNNIVILNYETTISCQAPPGQGIKPIVINVNGLVMNNQVNFTYESPSITDIIQNQSTVTIVGENFGQNFGSGSTIIKIGNQDITSSCGGNDTVLVCVNIPLGGQLTITNGGDTYSIPTTFYYNPFITQISEPITCMKSNLEINLKGGYFETIATNGIIEFFINSNNYSNFTVTNTTNISFFIPIGTGISNEIKVQFDNRISDPFIFSYCPPEIILPIIQNNNTLIVKGNGFGQVIEKVNITFGSIDNVISATEITDNEIKFLIPFESKDSDLKFIVDSQSSNLEFLSLSPIITSVTKPYMNGSFITITGDYLSTTNLYGDEITRNISYHLENSTVYTTYNQCQYLSTVVPYSIECLHGSGSGLIQIQISDNNNTLLSSTFEISYQTPKVISSSNPVYKKPGLITIQAVSFDPNNIQVYVESTLCKDPVVLNSSTIQCFYESNIPPKVSGQALNIRIDSIGVVGDDYSVLLYIQDYDCLNNCSNHGICNRKNGVCKCDKEWSDIDCSLNMNDLLPVPPPHVDNLGIVTLPAIKLDFQVSITHFREIDFSGKTIRVLRMNDIQWVERKDIPEKKSNYFKGIFKNDTVIIEFNTTLYENATTVQFAEQDLPIQANSMKYTITITKWNFNSSLNQLEVIYTSKTPKESIYNCETANTTNVQPDSETLTWFKIKSGATALNARFSNRAIIDTRLYEISISNLNETDELYRDYPKLVQNDDGDMEETDQAYLLTSLVSPSFQNTLVLDPDFGALLRSEESNQCDKSTSFAKWKIAVIVIFGTVACVAPLAAIFYFRYRPQINYKMQSFSNRLKNIRAF